MTSASPRLAKTRFVKALCVTTAAALSLALHGSLPYLGRLIPDRSAIATLEMFAYAEPQLLPIDVEDRQGEAADPEPEGPETDSDKEAPSGSEVAAEEEAETIAVEAVDAPESAEEPPPERQRVTEREPLPEAEKPPPPEARQRDLRARVLRSRVFDMHERRRIHAQRLAELRRRNAERALGGKGVAGEKKGEGGKGGGEGGGTARAEAKQGDPEAVYACSKDGLGKKVDVRFDRPISDWVTVVPTVLMPFEARPSMGEYLDGVSQVVSRRRGGVERAGPVEFALPAEVLQMNVDEPRGVRVALGHLDGRCLVGLKYTKELFPFELSRVPMRVIDHANRSQSALVSIRLFKDASFELFVHEGSVPFTEGRLANAKNIAETIEQHYAAARAFKAVAGWFGIDVAKAARDARLERGKDRKAQANAEKKAAKKSGKVVRRSRR